jgi:hypothetical protein
MKKVKIKKVPVMAYGGQVGFGLDLGTSKNPFDNLNSPQTSISKTLGPVDHAAANVEAELGETVVGDFDQDGQKEHFNIGGKRHSQGGTPLNLPDDAFIFSDTKKMQMGGSELAPFGKSVNGKKKYTPAELAKQYDINKYKAVLEDKHADPMSKKSAQLMIQNFENKLAQLALVQEAKKGFPQGIPEMAKEYLAGMTQDQEPAIGGTIDEVAPSKQFAYGGQLRKFFDGGNSFDDNPIDTYDGGTTKSGRYTPTRQDNKFNRGPEYLQHWEEVIPGVSKMGNKQAQSVIYDYMLKNHPDAVKKMWQGYGLTRKGMNDRSLYALSNHGKFSFDQLTPETLGKLKSAYVDGLFGVRQMDPLKQRKPFQDIPVAHVPNDLPPATIDPNKTPGLHFDTPQETPQPGIKTSPTSPTPFDYMTPDKWSVNQGFRNRGSLHKYLPWESPVSAVTPDPTFYDPNRQLANNNEQMNTQMMYSNTFSGPQASAARNSQIAGQAAANAVNIFSQYDNQNVQTANQFSGVSADIMNRLQEAKSRGAENLYAGTVIADQQYDNSKMKLDNDLLRAESNAWNNRSMLGMLNDTNPYFYTSPYTGRMTFKGGKDINGMTHAAAPSQSKFSDFYNMAIQQGMDDEYAKKYAYEMVNGQKVNYTDKNMDGIPDMARYAAQYYGMMNPYGMSQQ